MFEVCRRVLALGLVFWPLVEASLASGGEGKRSRPQFGWLISPLANGLGRRSFDLPFVSPGHAVLPEARIVYSDEGAAKDLKERLDPWNRSRHEELVRRLTQLVVRGRSFSMSSFLKRGPIRPWTKTSPPRSRKMAMFFSAPLWRLNEEVGTCKDGIGVFGDRTVPPIPILRRVVAGRGLLAFRPVDPEYGVRQIYTGLDARGSRVLAFYQESPLVRVVHSGVCPGAGRVGLGGWNALLYRRALSECAAGRVCALPLAADGQSNR